MAVTIESGGPSITVEPNEGESVLMAALRNGVNLPYQCGSGTCGTCVAELLAGEVHVESHQSASTAQKLHLCSSTGVGDCRIGVRKNLHLQWPSDVPIPANVRGTVVTRTMLPGDVLSVVVELDGAVDFAAGQYMLWKLEGLPGRRAYSMVNFEKGTSRLEFAIRLVPGGAFSQWLQHQCAEGTRVRMFGPMGRATFSPSTAADLVCIAGGTGIAPVLSVLECAGSGGYFDRQKAEVFFGVRTLDGAFLVDRLAMLAAKHLDRIKVTVAVSDEPGEFDLPATDEPSILGFPHIRVAKGVVTEVAENTLAGRGGKRVGYLGGPPAMINAGIRLLIGRLKVRAADIVFDKF